MSNRIEGIYGGGGWKVRCPICHDEAICELDEDALNRNEVLANRMACPYCDFVVQERHLFLCQMLLGKQLEASNAQIRKEFGLS